MNKMECISIRRRDDEDSIIGAILKGAILKATNGKGSRIVAITEAIIAAADSVIMY